MKHTIQALRYSSFKLQASSLTVLYDTSSQPVTMRILLGRYSFARPADLGHESIWLGWQPGNSCQLLSAEFGDTIPWNFRPPVVHRGAPGSEVCN